MIKDKDRSKWFGASETVLIVGNWQTKTFMELWLVKLGAMVKDFQTKYTIAGNMYERRIAESLGIPLRFDRCLKIPKLRLRVNLDSESKDCIYEIKTHKAGDKTWGVATKHKDIDQPICVPKNYWQQCQVQMWATGKHKCKIVAYPMEEANYDNFFLEVDKDKVEIYDIEFDPSWIQQVYEPRIKYLAYCLKKRKTPNKVEFEEKEKDDE